MRPLGKGGMATVYLAIQKSFEREVALKVMAASLSEDVGFSERFIHEAKVVSRLIHSHIVTVHDVGIHNGHHYLSMEYVPGRELKSCLGELSGEEVLRVLREIGSALDFAGQKGYVHRDVKPENIMLHAESGRAVLMDFGIAKADDVGSGLTQTGMALGTPYYMSPEQARGQKVDGRADLYSLGIVFYKMLLGTVPYDGDSAVTIGIKHISEPVPELPIRLAVFQPILNKLLAKNRGQRYQRGAELVADLARMSGAVIDKSRKQYFNNAATKKAASMAFSGNHNDTVLRAQASQQIPAAATGPSVLWLLPVLLVAALAGAYYFLFGLQLPPSAAAQQAALERLGLVEKPKLTLEQLLTPAIEPVAEQVVVEPVTGSDPLAVDADETQQALAPDTQTASQATGSETEIASAAEPIQPTLAQQVAELEQAYAIDPEQLPALIAAYQNLLAEQPGHAGASQGLATLESELLENVAAALDQQNSTDEQLAVTEATLVGALAYFPDLENNKRYQRLRSKLSDQQTLQQQLARAEQLFAQEQWLSPPEQNAKVYYDAVLAVDADNAKARDGLQRITQAYYQKALDANQQGRYQSALSFIAKGLSVNAAHSELKQLQSRVQTAQAKEQKITALLLEAEQLVQQGAVFSGRPNAVQTLQEVLAIAPGNSQARAQRQQLVEQLNLQVQGHISQRELDLAQQMLAPALALLQTNTVLQASQTEIDALQPVIERLKLSGEPITDLAQNLPEQFKASRVLHIGFSYNNFADSTTVLQATLYDGEQTVQIAAVPVIVSGQAGNNFFKIKRPVEGFKAGGYRLEILLANKNIYSQSFVIKP
ncbi:protein kinase [Dasania marina]|uniref:protein kinase domain-containing protein n=1 Tax=Dasania marina TaxID=471499 RepID=UPI0030DAF7EC